MEKETFEIDSLFIAPSKAVFRSVYLEVHLKDSHNFLECILSSTLAGDFEFLTGVQESMCIILEILDVFQMNFLKGVGI